MKNTGGEEARGGGRDARAGKVVGDMELGRGNLGGGGGKKGGTTYINRPKYITLTKGQSQMSGYPLLEAGTKPPYNEQVIRAR